MDLESLVRSVVEAAGLELVEVALRRGKGHQVLSVTVDREGGVDLDTIAQTSERISRRLDLEGFEPGPYTLEVSSPGIERPLKEPRDFWRRVGETVKVKASQPEGTQTLTGTLVQAGPDDVRISTEGGEREVPYDAIISARIVADWDAELRKKEEGSKR
jgi:ribosome maturation factor RimP